jgi:hypothetical protein
METTQKDQVIDTIKHIQEQLKATFIAFCDSEHSDPQQKENIRLILKTAESDHDIWRKLAEDAYTKLTL